MIKSVCTIVLLILVCSVNAADVTKDLHFQLMEAFCPSEFKPLIQNDSSIGAYSFLIKNAAIKQALEVIANRKNHDEPLTDLVYARDPAMAAAMTLLRKVYLYTIYNQPLFLEKIGFEKLIETPFAVDVDYSESHITVIDDDLTLDGAEAEYIVIGTGPAGSLIASEIVSKGLGKVIVLEQGSYVKPGVKTAEDSSLMESHNQRYSVDGGIAIRNGQAVGGGTIVNLDLAFSPLLPSIKSQMMNWMMRRQLDSKLIHEIGRDFAKIEKAYEFVKASIGTRQVEFGEINTNNRLLLNGHSSAKPYALNQKKPSDIGDLTPLKISATEAFLWKAQNKYPSQIQVIPNAKVERIHHDGTRASGVTITVQSTDNGLHFNNPHHLPLDKRQVYKIKAKNIIVCAGALGSAQILLNSNIPNKNIGRGLVLHPSIGVLGIFKEKIKNMDGLLASVYAPSEPLKDKYFFESMSSDPAFLASIHPGVKDHVMQTLLKFQNIGGFGVMLVDSVIGNNRVDVDKNGLAQVHYELSNQDKRRFRKAISEAIRILFDQGATEVIIPSLENIYENPTRRSYTSFKEAKKSIKKIQFSKNLTLLSSAHCQATNKMGSDSRNAVVSLKFKVWNQQVKKEFENLYVVDSSVFPSSIGANPMQSIYTFAKLLCDQILSGELNKNKLSAEA